MAVLSQTMTEWGQETSVCHLKPQYVNMLQYQQPKKQFYNVWCTGVLYIILNVSTKLEIHDFNQGNTVVKGTM